MKMYIKHFGDIERCQKAFILHHGTRDDWLDRPERIDVINSTTYYIFDTKDDMIGHFVNSIPKCEEFKFIENGRREL